MLASNIASAQASATMALATPGQPYGPGNMAEKGMMRELRAMIPPPAKLLFSTLQEKILEKVNEKTLAKTGYGHYYFRFQRAIRLSYTFCYHVKQIINLKYAGARITSDL